MKVKNNNHIIHGERTMKFINKALLFIIIFIIILPISFASDNITLNDDTLSLNDNNEILSSSYVYFDSSQAVDGNGSQNSPYNHLESNRLYDNSIAYFYNGEYNLDQTRSFNNLTIIGQNPLNTVINGNSLQLSSNNILSLYNITLNDLTIKNNNNFTAAGVIFENNMGSFKGGYGNVFGGAIYSASGNVFIDSSTFRNNNATYGGAIYTDSTNLKIINSIFENNHAYKYGGAIASEKNSTLDITNTLFSNCYTLTNAGGAIYTKESMVDVRKSNFTSCNATFGGAICDLGSDSIINSIIAVDNMANYQGGAIYKMYGKMNITSSVFDSNKAVSGGAVFLDNSSEILILSSKFSNNEAINDGGAIYTILNSKEFVSSNTYINNKAKVEKNYYKSPGYDLFIGNGDYTQYVGDFSFNGILPSKYDLRDYNQVTPVKSQKSSGNCWAFTSLAALESCILKASGESFDLSEENMKNIMAYYSDYGWKLEPNKGGYDDMGVGYLVSWLGPIKEDFETFSDNTVLSPLLNDTIHVQNVIYLTRTDYTDNDAVKEALIRYGAVATGIYYSGSYMKSDSYYYSGSNGPNHAVTIVGWDDNYSKNNFKTAAPGDGAWICKNSWGETWGNNGYFYVSYYDKNCVRLGAYDKSTYTIILNDTRHYDKNYQYDIIGITDYLITGNETMWYENIFKATDNELLTAFSTYFNTTTDWTAKIYVNNALKLTQNGVSVPGYYTFNLDNAIPLKTGDTFRIVIKISAPGKIASVPISEKVRSNRILYSKGISFFSYDGKNWIDLFDFKYDASQYGHSYESQVACIKAFTTYYSSSSIALDNLKSVSVDTPFNVVATVTDGQGNLIKDGSVIFTIDSKNFTVGVVNGKATLNTQLSSVGTFNILATYSGNTHSSSSVSNLINAIDKYVNLTLSISDIIYGDVLIIENTLTVNGLNVSGIIDVKIGSKTYSIVSNSKTQINDAFNPGEYSAFGYYSTIATANTTFNVNKAPLSMNLNIIKTDVDAVNITVTLSKAINDTILVNVNSKSYNVNVTNGNGVLSLNNLDYGHYDVKALYLSKYYQNANASGQFSVDYIKTNLNANDLVMYYHDGTRFYVTLKDKNNNPLHDQEIKIYLNGLENKKKTDEDGLVSMGINLNSGNYPVYIEYSGDDIYLPSNISRTITVKSTIISSDIVKYYRNGTQYLATILDYKGNPVANVDVDMNINGVFYKRTTNEYGIVQLNINLMPDKYILTIHNPITDEVTANYVTVLSRLVDNHDLVKYYRNASSYSVKVLDEKGSPLAGADVSFNINGVFYTRTSDSNGVASLTINLIPGTYIITAGYGTALVSNKIKVLSIIEAEDLVMTYKDGSSFKALILNGQGNPYPNQLVIFNINGVFYTRMSNSTGFANLNINLIPGKYIITSQCNGLSVSNTIVINSP